MPGLARRLSSSDGLESMIFRGCISSSRERVLLANPILIRYRTMMLGAIIVWVFLAITLMTVLYAARRSISVILFNTLQGLMISLGFIGFLRVNFYFIILSLASFSSVTGIIFLYVLIVSIVQEDGAYFLLHGTMILAMDVPICLLFCKAAWEYYQLYYRQRSVVPGPTGSVSGQPEIVEISVGGNPNIIMIGGNGNLNYNNDYNISNQYAVQLGQSGQNNLDANFNGHIAAGDLAAGAGGSAANAIPNLDNDLNDYSTPSVKPEDACPICLTRKKNIAIVTCGHLLCETCANHMCPGLKRIGPNVKCPVCRNKITQFVKVFL